MSPPAADGGGVLEAGVMANGGGVTEPLDDAHVTASSARFATVLRCRVVGHSSSRTARSARPVAAHSFFM
jgi:hypothetical protein